mgnify:CR=1 FL=1
MKNQLKTYSNKPLHWVFSITLLLSLFTFQGFSTGSSLISPNSTSTTELVVSSSFQQKRSFSFKNAFREYWSKALYSPSPSYQPVQLLAFNHLVLVHYISLKQIKIPFANINLHLVKTIPQSFKNEEEA